MDPVTLAAAKSYVKSLPNLSDISGLVSPFMRHQRPEAIDLFESGWTQDVGTMANDAVNKRYGTQSTKLTTRVGASGQISKTKSVKAKNKLILVNFYVHDVTKISSISLVFRFGAAWTTYVTCGGIEPQTNYRFIQNGYNEIVINPALGTITGVTEVNDHLDNIAAIRMRVDPVAGETAEVSFDRIALIDNPLKRGVVTLTFDDGNVTDRTEAAVRMAVHGYKGTTYIIGSQVGNASRMTLDQLKELYEMGWDISSHSWIHDYDYSTPEKIKTEIEKPYEWLIANGFSRSADHFAYPGGVTNADVEKKVSEIYTTARSLIGAGFTTLNTVPCNNVHRLHRVVASDSTVSSAKTAITNAIKYKSWAILMFHAVSTTASSGSMTPDNFQEIIDHLYASGAYVLTMSEMCMYLPLARNNVVERKANKVGSEDIEITDSTKGVILTAPNGTKYRMTVDNTGSPVFTAL